MFFKNPGPSESEKTHHRKLPVDLEVYVHEPSGLQIVFGAFSANDNNRVAKTNHYNSDDETNELAFGKDLEDRRPVLEREIHGVSPLCSVSIVVHTPCKDNTGLPHTLEHLVFMGSEERFPHRGHLDALASRCMSNGTNAYTEIDHTVYTTTAVGFEPIAQHLLPAFLDHILRPKLTKEAFLTEVVHVDPLNGRYRGVVFCEMEAREYTEGDLLERTIRSLLFPNTPYAFECGGLTSDIPTLDLDRVIDYHRKYYRPSNMMIIVVGADLYDEEKQTLFQGLERVLGDFLGQSLSRNGDVVLGMDSNPIITALGGSKSARVYFPSGDEENGSVVLGWRGPPLWDLKSCMALDILLTYLQENSASPLHQFFVERIHPLASSVHFDWLTSSPTGISLTFSGVHVNPSTTTYQMNSIKKHAFAEDSRRDGKDTIRKEDFRIKRNIHDSPFSMLNHNHIPGLSSVDYGQLLREGYFRDLVLILFKNIYRDGFPDGPDAFKRMLIRSRTKFLEGWEEESHQVFTETVILGWRSLKQAQMKCNLLEYLLRRLDILYVYDILEQEPARFWLDLLKTYFIDAHVVDLIAMPSLNLAIEHERENETCRRQRYKSFTKTQLTHMTKAMEKAVQLSQMQLPASVLQSMPPLKLHNSIPRLSCHVQNRFIGLLPHFESENSNHTGILMASNQRESPTMVNCSGFNWQIVHTVTSFCHIKLFLDLNDLPDELRLLLVLYKALLFECPVSCSHLDNQDCPEIPNDLEYDELVRLLNDSLVSYASDVGLGGDTFSCSYLNTVLVISAACEPSKFAIMCSLICRVLFCTVFNVDRIKVFIQNLLTDIIEMMRDGDEMVDAVATAKSEMYQKSNDTFLSIFAQRSFLEHIAECLKHGEKDNFQSTSSPSNTKASSASLLIVALNRLRSIILLEKPRSSVFQIVLPYGHSEEIIHIFENSWSHFVTSIESGVRKVYPATPSRLPGSFRILYDPPPHDILVIVPMKGVDSSYLVQTIPCQVLNSRDQYAVSILATLLSRTEGPLYSGLRGRGYLYDVKLMLHIWHGEISFSMREAGCPDQALWFFYDLLRQIDQNPLAFFDEWQVETAKACVFYQIVASQSTPASIIEKISRLTYTGFRSLEEADTFEQSFYQINREDLIHVFRKYLLKFLPVSTDPKLIVLTTSDAKAKSLRSSFFKHARYPLKFEIESLDAQFQPVQTPCF